MEEEHGTFRGQSLEPLFNALPRNVTDRKPEPPTQEHGLPAEYQDRFTNRLHNVIYAAFEGQQSAPAHHILGALLECGSSPRSCSVAQTALENSGLMPNMIYDNRSRYAADISLTVLIEKADAQRDRLGHEYLGPEHLLLAICYDDPASELYQLLDRTVGVALVKQKISSTLSSETSAREPGIAKQAENLLASIVRQRDTIPHRGSDEERAFQQEVADIFKPLMNCYARGIGQSPGELAMMDMLGGMVPADISQAVLQRERERRGME